MQKLIWWTLAAAASGIALASLAATPPNLASALEAQQELVYERPTDARVYNDLGNLLVLSGRLDEAEAAYKRSLELGSDRVSPSFNLGLLQQQRGRLKAAMEAYQAAIAVDPTYAWAHYQIGTLFEAQGDSPQAIKAYAQAFALDSQLAFSEVNPHIIENKLVTEALFAAHQGSGGGILAPKAYDEPNHIVRLLLPSRQGDSESEDPGEGPVESAEASSEGAERVLSENDLDSRGRLNQASPAGRRGSPAARRGSRSASSRSADKTRGRTTQRRPPQRGRELGTQVGRPSAGASAGQPVAGAPAGRTEQEIKEGRGAGGGGRTSVPQQRVRFRPGTPSTSRLEIRLTPETEATEMAPAG